MKSDLADPATNTVYKWLGSGVYCVVYEAVAPNVDPFAIKIVRSELSAADIEDGETLIRYEAGILARISLIESVVGFLDADLNRAMLMMERAPGRNLLDSLANRGIFSSQRLCRVGAQWATVLDLLHQLGVVHGDVKPPNAVGSRSGKITVIDFGSSHVLPSSLLYQMNADVPLMGLPSSILGHSPLYCSPEQVLGMPPTPAWDMYGLGASLYQLASGVTLFIGDTPNEVERQHVVSNPRPIIELVPGIPPGLAEVIMGCISKSPDERPSAAQASTVFRRLRP